MIMQSAVAEKLKAANLTVKLESSDHERLKVLATQKKRTPHYIMREAIQKYLTEEEAEQRFIELAEQSWEDYENSGLHISLDEAKAWAKTLIEDPNSVPPACHT